MPIPQDYAERVYAGVLGKIIGVYFGRPFEGWTHERIMAELGAITWYVHERLGAPLVVTDDDISGTFTFLRALEDYGFTRDVTARQIGQTWLNAIIEERTILWWGGMGNSTEHTAYLRLKSGIPAPASGAIATNGKVVAEQIGAQIFVDGWAMVAPGDPELAVRLAGRAASVSHDGEAIYGAQVLAAMEAQAFVEADLQKLMDCAVAFIPTDSVIFRMLADIREWHARESDWRETRRRIATHYGYDTYGGNCHIVPNHALIALALLYGEDDFQRSLTIVNTSGWDTDCNSGNVGCLLGIKNGLAGIDDGPDLRGPVADRMYLSTADGGGAITDALTEAYRVVNAGRRLADEPPIRPKDGARFHFAHPGAVQGWQPDNAWDARGTLIVDNVAGHSRLGDRSLALAFRRVAPGCPARATTPTFIPPEAITMPGYDLLASPTLYSGQTVRARVEADGGNRDAVTCGLFVRAYNGRDELDTIAGPSTVLGPGTEHAFSWRMPDTGGQPIAQVGVEISSARAVDGTLYLDELRWDGMPEVTFGRPAEGGTLWRRAWVNGVDHADPWWPKTYRLAQDRGTGLLIQGTREWTDYRASAPVVPHMVRSAGLAARVQGMRRYYALLLTREGMARLVKALDGEAVLAEAEFPWQADVAYDLALEVERNTIRASIDGRRLFDVQDDDGPLMDGAIALVCEEGQIACDRVRVAPLA